MLEVEIRNFCCIYNSKFTFDKGLTLIKGVNGSGKSTIFKAIEWCLYGKIKQTYHLDVEKPKKGFTSVKIKINEITIKREKPPDSLWVEYQGSEFIGAEAQGVVNEYFGSRNCWVTSSLLTDGIRNPLISYSSNEKIEIIKEIFFGTSDEKPEFYLNRIDTEIKKREKEYEKEKNVLDYSKEKFDIYIKEYNLNLEEKMEYDKTEDERRRKIRELNQQIREMIEKRELFKKVEEAKVLHPKVKEELKTMPITKPKKVWDWRKDCELRKKISEIKQKIDIDVIEIDIETGEAKLSDLTRKKKDRPFHEKLASSLNIVYAEKEISTEREKIKVDIERAETNNRKREIWLRYNGWKIKLKELEDKYNTLKHEKNEILKKIEYEGKDLNEAVKKIDQITTSTLLVCPECKNHLIFEKNSLKKNKGLTVAKDTANKYKKSLKKMIEIEKEISDLQIKMKEINMNVDEEIEEIDIKSLMKRFSEVSELKYIEKVSDEEIEKLRKSINQSKLKQEFRKLEEQVNPEFSDLSEPTDFDKYAERLTELRRMHKEMKELVDVEISDYTDPEKIEEKRNKEEQVLERVRYYNQRYEKWDRGRKMKREIEERRKDLLRLRDLLTIQEKIRGVIVDVTNSTLESMLNDVNEVFNYILEQFFISEEPYAEMLLFKKLKSKDLLKPQFNIQLKFKGYAYDDIHSFSTGEKDGISLALLLAFNTISQTPFIILDECLSFMNQELKERVIFTLRERFSDIPVLSVCHEITEGYFDNVIEL